MVGLTLDMLKEIKKRLLPTPKKIFYLFNLRDIARLVHYMLIYSKSLS